MRPRLMRIRAAIAASSLILALESGAFTDAHAVGSVTGGFKGLDMCTDPTIAEMQAFWNGTPYWNWYVYIGGVNACDQTQPNLSAGWINTVIGNVPSPTMNWDIVPIWVGLQAICTMVQGAAIMSADPGTAYNQGVNEAIAAVNKWNGPLGQSFDTPIVFDLEPFDAISPTCQASLPAAQSFIAGWDHQLQLPPAQRAGLFGSACSSHLQRFVDD